MAEGTGGHVPSKFFRNRQIFGNCNASSENFGLLLLVKIKASNFVEKSSNLPLPPTLQVK